MRVLGTVVINAVAIWVATWLLPGLTVARDQGTMNSVITFLAIGVVFGVVNAVVRPVVKFLAFPLYILTLGLFAFIVNAAMLWLTSEIAGWFGLGFHLDSFFWTAVLGAVIISVVAMLGHVVLDGALSSRDEDRRALSRAG